MASINSIYNCENSLQLIQLAEENLCRMQEQVKSISFKILNSLFWPQKYRRDLESCRIKLEDLKKTVVEQGGSFISVQEELFQTIQSKLTQLQADYLLGLQRALCFPTVYSSENLQVEVLRLNRRIANLLPSYQEQISSFAEKRGLLESSVQRVEGALKLCSEVRSPRLTQRIEACQEWLNVFAKALADRVELIASREKEIEKVTQCMRVYFERDKANSIGMLTAALEVKVFMEDVDWVGNLTVIEWVSHLTDAVSRYLESKEPELQLLGQLEEIFGNSETREGPPIALYFDREDTSLVGLILHPFPESLSIIFSERILNPYIANSEQSTWRESFLESVIRKQVKSESWVISYDQKKGTMTLFPKKAELCENPDSKIPFSDLDPGLDPYSAGLES